MNKEFVSYEIGLELKKIGFDIPNSHYYLYDGTFGTFSIFDKSTNTELVNRVVSGLEDKTCTAPRVSEVLKYFRDVQGLYVHNVPEFYTNGINFSWQILWYTPKEKWEYRKNDPEQPIRHTICDGTYLYGDNNEFPTQEDADLGAIKLMIEIAKIGKFIYLDEINKKRLNGDYER